MRRVCGAADTHAGRAASGTCVPLDCVPAARMYGDARHCGARHPAQRAVYAAGEDELFKQATNLLSQTLERENLNALYNQARATGSFEDDKLVNKLTENDRRIKLLQQTLDSYRNNHQKQLVKLDDLEKLRTQYKRERFDDIRSGFENKALLAMLLNQFLH